MKPLLILTLGAALSAGACGSPATDTTGTATASGSPASTTSAVAPAAAPAGPTYREVTIPAGTTLPLTLTSAIGSDSSAVEDAVTAERTRVR